MTGRESRRAEVFGDVLPESTGDDRDDDARLDERGPDGRDRDAWYLENRPPHHD